MFSFFKRCFPLFLSVCLFLTSSPALALAPRSVLVPDNYTVTGFGHQVHFRFEANLKNTQWVDSAPYAQLVSSDALQEFGSLLNQADHSKKVNVIIDRLKGMRLVPYYLETFLTDSRYLKIAEQIDLLFEETEAQIKKREIRLSVHPLSQIGFFKTRLWTTLDSHMRETNLPLLVVAEEREGRLIFHVTRQFYIQYGQSSDFQKRMVFYEALLHSLLKRALADIVDTRGELQVQFDLDEVFAATFERLIEQWGSEDQVPEMSALQRFKIDWAYEKGKKIAPHFQDMRFQHHRYDSYLEQATYEFPHDFNGAVANYAAEKLLEFYPYIRQAIEGSFDMILKTTWLKEFGYAPFLKNFFYRGEYYMHRFDSWQSQQKLAHLIKTKRDARILTEFEFYSRDLFDEVADLFLLLEKRLQVNSLNAVIQATSLERHIFPFEFVVQLLVLLYKKSGLRFVELFLRHGLASLILNDVIQSYDDIRKWIDIMEKSEYLPVAMANVVRIDAVCSDGEVFIADLAKAYFENPPSTPKEELELLIDYYLQEKNQQSRNYLIFSLRYSELIHYFDEENFKRFLSNGPSTQYEDAWLLEGFFQILILRRPGFMTPEVVDMMDGYYSRAQYGYSVDKAVQLMFSRHLLKIKEMPQRKVFYNAPHLPVVHSVLHDKENPKVLILHNIADGMGDELIRNGTVMPALLDLNPALEIFIYTQRPFLYSHPRVHVSSYFDLKDLDKLPHQFDMIVDHYDKKQNYFNLGSRREEWDARPLVLAYLEYAKAPVFYRTDKEDDLFQSKDFAVNGKKIDMQVSTHNVYDPIYQICAKLNLPFRVGTRPVQSKEGFLFTAIKGPQIDSYWDRIQKQKEKVGADKVAVFNPFGGENGDKGYPVERIRDMMRIIDALIKRGYFVVILPSGRWFEGALSPEWFRSSRWNGTAHLQGHMMLMPEPGQYPLLHKQLIDRSDLVVTVEGGIQHLAFNLGKKMIAMMMKGSGYENKWAPLARSATQIVIPIVTLDRMTAAIDRILELEAEEEKPALELDMGGVFTAEAI